jgi:multiple sugar transport system ATP-binding protein
LGGGQKQRISLARALVRDPDVFLLDEPLSHLDAAQRANMRVELKRLHAAVQRTMVLVTHDQLEAIAMAERIAVMNFGVLQQVGTFDEVYNHPANEFVAGFIGEPPMNFLACKPVRRGDDLSLVADDGSFDRALPSMWRARVDQAQPTALHLGVRPIDIRLANGGPPPFQSIDINARVKTFEALGEEGQLAAMVGDTEVLVVTPHDVKVRAGEDVTLQLNTQRVHLFDAGSTRAV